MLTPRSVYFYRPFLSFRRMSSADLPRDLVSCETSLSEHNDAQTEIRGKHEKFAEAEKAGEKLVADDNYNKAEIKKCLDKLEKMEDEVWDPRPRFLALTVVSNRLLLLSKPIFQLLLSRGRNWCATFVSQFSLF